MASGWGWAGTVAEFLSLGKQRLLSDLADHHQRLLLLPPSASQLKAWEDEHDAMSAALRECVTALQSATGWSVVFEYELPLEGGRRPDVVVLAGGTVVVIEFKGQAHHYQAHLDQVDAYARDLADYHEATHGRPVVPILVMTDVGPVAGRCEDTIITDPDGLSRYLFDAKSDGAIDLPSWLDAPYVPLPSLVEAARRIFQHEPLPHVHSALSAGIPETIDLISRLLSQAASSGSRLAVFVSGVPGSGKTLVGLRLVYERSETSGRATFLSGNGPLVQVLQDALGSTAFVRDLHAFIRTYGIRERTPKERILVFDEAQRAWDRAYMLSKRGVDASEPELLVTIGERIPEWSALVGLVGDGQEIYSGEEGGMGEWRSALSSAQAWRVHCAPRLVAELEGLDADGHDELDLTVSLRTRRAEQLHTWVHLVLEGSLALAARQAVRVQRAEEYPIYLTRDLEDARDFVRVRYEQEPDKRFGLVASSHAKNLSKHGVDNGWVATSRMKVAKWFNAPPSDPLSSCALTQPVTEFGCQGLELDMPVVCWGTDYRWTGEDWNLKPIRRRYRQDDPSRLLQNAYRVLLTRGRDGMVIFIPPDADLNLTEHALLAAGVKPLPDAMELVEEASASGA